MYRFLGRPGWGWRIESERHQWQLEESVTGLAKRHEMRSRVSYLIARYPESLGSKLDSAGTFPPVETARAMPSEAVGLVPLTVHLAVMGYLHVVRPTRIRSCSLSRQPWAAAVDVTGAELHLVAAAGP